MKNDRLNDEDRRQWIANDEGLYLWQRRSGLSMQKFIRENRAEIDAAIIAVRDGVKPQHFLAYDHSAGCMCARCQRQRKGVA